MASRVLGTSIRGAIALARVMGARMRGAIALALITGFMVLGLVTGSLGQTLPPMAQGTPQTAPPSSPSGSPLGVQTLPQYQQQLEQYRQGLAQEQQRLQQLERQSQQTLNQLQQSIQGTVSDRTQNTQQLQAAQQAIATLQTLLTQAQQRYITQRDHMASRLRWLQRQPRAQGWAVLLHSSNLGDLWARNYRLKRLYDRDREELAQLRTTYQTLQQQQSRLESQKNSLALVQQQLLNQQSQFQNQATLQSALVQRLRSDRLALEAAEAQLERDSAAIAQLIQARLGSRGYAGGYQGSGRLRYPVNGPISSNFGWREHPVLGTRRLHAGLDFAVDYDTPIGAAQAGTVVYADWYGGYGNAVIIDHGGGITTLYAHASELQVREGDVVQSGQIVALVGSTGLSTGPHLHFEVREDGEPVDPLNYL